jgi:integrase
MLIAEGKDPFITTGETLNDIFDERLKQKVADLLKIHKGMTNVANSTKNTLKMILRPIFTEQIKLGNIHENHIDKLKTYNMPVRESLELRTDEKHLDIVRKLYHAIPLYKTKSDKQLVEIHTFLYLVLLTSHRFGELLKLDKENCYIEKGMIISPKTITKTKEDYKFPIPKECLDYISSIESGLLFPSVKRGSLYQIFQRVVILADIELAADTCLNHKQRGTVNHYLSFVYEDIEKAYSKYWELIRSK